MRYPDDEGFVWKTVARLRDMVAGELPGRRSFIAFPRLTGRSVHRFEHLEPAELDCYRLDAQDRAALRRFVSDRQIGAIVYMSALPATLDLPFLQGLGLLTINTEDDGFDPVRRDPAHRWLAKFVVRRLLGRQLHDLHIANSRAQGAFLRRFAHVPPRRLLVIPNGVDCGHFTPGPPPRPPLLDPARRWILCVSQARAEKRVDLILRSMARIAAQAEFADVSLAYVGAGDELARWRELAASLGIADRVCFAGHQDNTLPWYRSASIMVHAAERESFGLVIAEAMACALPVVAMAAAGPAEIVADGVTGQLVPMGDEAAFGEAIEGYLRSPERTQAHGEAGRQRAQRHFSIHRQARAIAAALDRVLDSRAGLSPKAR